MELISISDLESVANELAQYTKVEVKIYKTNSQVFIEMKQPMNSSFSTIKLGLSSFERSNSSIIKLEQPNSHNN